MTQCCLISKERTQTLSSNNEIVLSFWQFHTEMQLEEQFSITNFTLNIKI